MAHLIKAESISEAWEQSLKLFLSNRDLVAFSSERGSCHEIENVIIASPIGSEGEKISDLYPKLYTQLIDTYTEGFTSRASRSTVASRIFSWKGRDGTTIDQFEDLVMRIKSRPNSRFNLIGFWDPKADNSSNTPVSPISCNFRVRHGHLDVTLVSRSVDAWLGGFAMFIATARLARSTAERCGLELGSMTSIIYSYHIYDIDLPFVFKAARGLS